MGRITKKYMTSIGFEVHDAKGGWVAIRDGGTFRMFRRMTHPRSWTFACKAGSTEKAFKSTRLTVEQFESITKILHIDYGTGKDKKVH